MLPNEELDLFFYHGAILDEDAEKMLEVENNSKYSSLL